MKIKMLDNINQLENTAPFRISNLLWGTEAIPETFGYLGFLTGKGFCLKMICMESDPLRTYTADQSPVCMDSTVEAFFNFTLSENEGTKPVYVNFEINSNGALLAQYGTGREGRTLFPEDAMREITHSAWIENGRWSINLFIPVSVLEKVYGSLSFQAGSRFTCNFYKICETDGQEHYASWSPVITDQPDFHRPEYFGEAVLAPEN